MKGFVDDIEELTEDNKDFRRVLYIGQKIGSLPCFFARMGVPPRIGLRETLNNSWQWLARTAGAGARRGS